MSTVIQTFITCDGNCGENYGVDAMGNNITASDQRASARNEGWVFTRGKDYCPNCKKSNRTNTKEEKS